MSGLAWTNVGAKVVLVGLILFYFARPELSQFEGAAMPLRTAFFPVAALLVPALWWFERRDVPYPHLPDTLIVVAAVVDYGGNAADMYRFGWFDHTVHFVNMLLLNTAFGAVMSAHELPRWALAGLVLGFGSVLHTIWEITEYLLVAVFGTDLEVDAATTIRDFAAGLAGTSIAAALVYRVLWQRSDHGGALLGGETVSAVQQRRQRETVEPLS